MPDKVALVTSDWKNKSDKPDEFSQAEWDAYNSSKFNGFPFPTIEKAQDNNPFESWDKETTYQDAPSKSADRLISVLGDHYSYKFTYDQLFKFFWRMKGFKLKVGSFEDTSSRTGRRVKFIENPTLSFDTETNFKNEESKLVTQLNTNFWVIDINGCSITFNFNAPVLKLGEDDYRVFVVSDCIDQESGCDLYTAQGLVQGLLSADDLPAIITLRGFGSLTKSGTNYGNTTNGVILEDGKWSRYLNGVRKTQLSLIQGDSNVTPGDDVVEDQFEECYKIYVYMPFFNSTTFFGTVYRKSACRWDNFEGFDESGMPSFGDGISYGQIRWSPSEQKWDLDLGGFPYYFLKVPHQDTPLGSYQAPPDFAAGGAPSATVESC